MAGHGNPFDAQEPIKGVKHVILVGSGKGGVGKSTVTVNLALALAQTGAQVGLLDADIYGPSLPRMLGCLGQKPMLSEDHLLLPLERMGLRLMSIGFLVDEGAALIWRGPMLFKALDQFFREVYWGDLDYLVVDLPPGTGDVQLSIAQKVPVSGAIVVTTPQNVALSDVKRAVDMFTKVKVPILGLIENMSYFQPQGQSERYQLFPKGELDQYLKETAIEKLAELPFNTQISMAGEVGIPYVESHRDAKEAKIFAEIAKRIRTTDLNAEGDPNS